MPEQLNPSVELGEALKKCQLTLGCVARGRCIAGPIREGAKEIAHETRVEQGWAELQAEISGEEIPLDEQQIEVLEGQADFLEEVRKNLAKCGIVRARMEAHPETA